MWSFTEGVSGGRPPGAARRPGGTLLLGILFAVALYPGSAMAKEPDWKAAESEYRQLLEELIAVDTSNPPGNEVAADEILKRRLEREGIPAQIVVPDSGGGPKAGRGNLIARLAGTGQKKPILLLGHMDVVGVQRDKWTSDPFRLTERDGHLYGRGVIDDKGMVAAEAMALILLKRMGAKLERDVIFLAECDEEAGGDWGIAWLLEHRRELIDAEFALNEGGRVMLDGGEVRWVGLQNAEKRPVNMRLVAHGSSGHASMPRPDNPLVILARALERLADRPFPVELTPETREFFPAVAATQPEREMAEAMRGIVDPARAEDAARVLSKDLMFGAMVRHTMSPTMLNAGFRANVIPSTAEATVNVRMLPGSDPAAVADSMRARIADPRVEVTFTPSTRPESPSSPFSGPLVEAVTAAARHHFPKAPVVPLLSTGATDSAELRGKGIPSYGLLIFPLDGDDTARMHGDDERMPVASLGAGLRFLYEIVSTAAR